MTNGGTPKGRVGHADRGRDVEERPGGVPLSVADLKPGRKIDERPPFSAAQCSVLSASRARNPDDKVAAVLGKSRAAVMIGGRSDEPAPQT